MAACNHAKDTTAGEQAAPQSCGMAANEFCRLP
jgi:hypothetical protein